MQQVRKGWKFSSFFKYATIVKATDLTTTFYQGVQINGRRNSGDRTGEDIVTTLPIWPKAAPPEASLHRRTQDTYGFEFRTHLPEVDVGHDARNVDLSRLYFIRLLPNELPSYHFWASPTDQPGACTKNRTQIDSPGSPHYDDRMASSKQKLRSHGTFLPARKLARKVREIPPAPLVAALARNRSRNRSRGS
jgi:hypothetical protein